MAGKRVKSSRITLKDVANLAGVSAQTVSFVVNRNPVISEETRIKVLEAIRQLGYTPNASARSLRLGVPRVIGLLVPDGHNPHFWSIIDGAEQESLAQGYSLLVATTAMDRQRERVAFNAITQQHLAGIILMLTYPEDYEEDVASLHRQNIPVVVDGVQFANVDRVWFHYRTAAREMMDHLLGLGHRKIAFIQGVGRQDFAAGKDRADVYQQKMREAGFGEEDLRVELCGSTLAEGYAAAKRLLKRDPGITAIVAMNDLIAAGAIHAVRESGLSVPEDISVAGFDDDELFRYTHPPLTSGAADGAEFGRKAVRLVLKRIAEPHAPRMRDHVVSSLVVRKSTGPVRRTI